MNKDKDIIELYNQMNAFGRHLDMRFKIIEPGCVHYRMKIKPEHQSTPQATHGGAIAAFMDGVLGVAALSLSAKDQNIVSTVEFKINYLKPVKPATQLLGIGKVISAGKRLMVVQGEIFDEENNELLALGNGTFNAYPASKLKF